MIGMTEALATNLLENGNTTGKRNMSHDLLQCRNDDNTPLSKKELVGEMLAFTTAGSDPTAYEISAILDRICRHGDVREKLLQELRAVGELEQSSAEGVVTYAQTLRLPYLLAVVKETMRLNPAFQGQFSRVAPEGGCGGEVGGLEVLPGVVVPGGVWLSINTYVSQRDKLVFGEDAEEFKPERWLPIGGDRYHAMSKYLSVFGYGSTACMGQHLASQKINKTVVEILRRFNVELKDPKTPLKERNIIQMFISDLFMTFTEREKKI
jgi:cytochrome P450